MIFVSQHLRIMFRRLSLLENHHVDSARMFLYTLLTRSRGEMVFLTTYTGYPLHVIMPKSHLWTEGLLLYEE